MSKSAQRRTILMADDDGEDCILVGDALRETGRSYNLHFVHNGEELFDYLRHQGEYEEGRNAPLPDLILLDLKMPRKDGRETLRELKSDSHWRQIPVVVLTTSTAGDGIKFCYDMGVNSYVTKPATYRELVEIFKTLTKYWFEVAELPPKARHGGKTH
jgi:two-component system, response regulator